MNYSILSATTKSQLKGSDDQGPYTSGFKIEALRRSDGSVFRANTRRRP